MLCFTEKLQIEKHNKLQMYGGRKDYQTHSILYCIGKSDNALISDTQNKCTYKLNLEVIIMLLQNSYKTSNTIRTSPYTFSLLVHCKIVHYTNYALERQSSRGEVIPGGNPTGMSYLFYYTEQIQNTKGGEIKTPEILDKYSSSALMN